MVIIMNKFKLLLVLASIISISCESALDIVVNAQTKASMKVEYDYMEFYDEDNNLFGIIQYVIDAFSDAGIKSEFYADTGNILPQYDAWGYFPTDDKKLREYAKLHYDFLSDGLNWHLLYVDLYEGNKNELTTLGIAANLNNGFNTPPTPVNERFSMLFWQDIKNNYPDSLLQRIGVFLTTHELGHQRAGLSDIHGPDGQPQYHNMTDNNGDSQADIPCVMSYFSPFTLEPVFCYDTPDDLDNTNSCNDILQNNKDVN